MVERNNILAITPRFEGRWFELHLPLILYNDTDPHVGLSARFGVLTIGTDNLFSLVGKQKFTGTDAYLALRIGGKTLDKLASLKVRGKAAKGSACYSF